MISRVNRLRLLGQAGFTLLEVLVAIVVIAFGLLGLAALQARALTAEAEAYQRGQAIVYIQDIVDRINANRRVAPCFAAASPFGTGVSSLTACSGLSVEQTAMSAADTAMASWQALLVGSNEKSSSTDVGGISGARGCIKRDTADASTYYIAIAWQGRSKFDAPTAPNGANQSLVDVVACGSGNYGNEAYRRAAWVALRVATLN